MGVGPGHPGLATVQAIEAIKEADFIRRSDGCGSALLHHARPGTDIGALDDLDEVAMTPFGRDVVDPHAAGLLAPVEIVESPAGLAARLDLRVGSDGVLQIAKNMIGRGGSRLLQHLVAAAGDGRLRVPGAFWLLTHG